MAIDTFEKHVQLIKSLFDGNGIAKPYRAEPHWMLRAIFSQLSEASHLEKRFIVENATEKYLKNFISSSTKHDLQERMNGLFTNGLNGLEAGVDGMASEEILTAFRNAVENAEPVPDGESWDVRETIRILRSDSEFYKWVFAQEKDIKLYRHHNQYQARGDYERTCIMLPVFRKAQEFADSAGMNYRDVAGSGFDLDHNMFIGEKCLMRKCLTRYPAVEVVVCFSANSDDRYPVEIFVAWPKGKFEPEAEKQFVDAIPGETAFQAGSERQSLIGKWNFSPEISGKGKITLAELKGKVENLVNTPPLASTLAAPKPTP